MYIARPLWNVLCQDIYIRGSHIPFNPRHTIALYKKFWNPCCRN